MSANNQPYLNPASAIDVMAAKNYRITLRMMERGPEEEKSAARQPEIWELLISDEFRILLNPEPDLFGGRLNQEACQ